MYAVLGVNHRFNFYINRCVSNKKIKIYIIMDETRKELEDWRLI